MTPSTLPPTLPGSSPLANGFALKRDPLAFFRRLAQEGGPISHFALSNGTVYFINDPALVREILLVQEPRFRKWAFNDSFHVIFGSSLIGSAGELHRQMQKAAQPSFRQQRLEDYARIMVSLTNEAQEHWEEGEFDISGNFLRLTLEIVGYSLLSRSLQDFASRIIAASDTLLRFSNQLGASEKIDRDYAAASEEMSNIAQELLDERLQRPKSGDLLDHLLEVNGANATEEDLAQVNEEIRTFILAGHITSTNILAAAFILLAQHEDAEKKLHEEIDYVLGGRLPEFADLVRLPFCEMIVRETLRLYPPVWVLGREVIEEEVVLGDYTLPIGTKLVLSPWIFHHDPRFFEEPDSFSPARWEEAGAALPKFTFLPFSSGPRSCIGERFAMTEITLMLAIIAQRWKFRELPGKSDPGWSPQIIYWPRRPISLGATRR